MNISSYLPATNGQAYSLVESGYFTDKRTGIVLIFTSVQCPYALQYFDTILAISSKEKFGSIAFAFVNSNKTLDEDSEEMDEMISTYTHQTVPFIRDAEKEWCNSFNASFTPEFFLLNMDYEVVTSGAVDSRFKTPGEWQDGLEGHWPWDEQLPPEEKITYLEMALDAFLSGSPVPAFTRSQIGCTIK